MPDTRDPKLAAFADILNDHVKDAADAFQAVNTTRPAVLVLCAHGTAVELTVSVQDRAALARLMQDIAAEWLAEAEGDDCFVPARADRLA